MARVTIEDCLDKISSRFDLVVLASKRANYLVNTGEQPRVEWDNDKITVVALREIAEEKITPEEIRESR